MPNSDPIPHRGTASCLLLLALFVSGCGYGPVSPAAYEHAKSLYTLANLQATDSLEAAESAIADDTSAGLVSAREAEWLNDIGTACRDEEWKVAQSAARRMMEDQAGR